MERQTLPLELVFRILHNTYFVEEGVKDSSTLSACSLVSPSWTEEAQRLLHHSIRVASCPSFRPHDIPLRIGSLVRSLEVSVGYSEIPVGDFVTLLAHCPHVYELHLRITEHELDDVTLDLLSNAPTPLRIVALNLQYCGVQSPILFQLLFLWPTIEFLRLGTEIAASPPFNTPTFRLYELTLLRNPPVATLLWLLSNSVGYLRILDFRDPPGHKFELLFDQHGPHLHSLRFFRHAGGAKGLIQRCPNLKELVLLQISNYLKLEGLPRTLEHFSFRNFVWGQNKNFEPIIALLAESPNLKIITCDRNATDHQDFSRLEECCKEKGVVLSTDAPSTLVENESKWLRGRIVERRIEYNAIHWQGHT